MTRLPSLLSKTIGNANVVVRARGRSSILHRFVLAVQLFPELVQPVDGDVGLQLSPPSLLPVHANVAKRWLLLDVLKLLGELLDVSFLVLGVLGVDGAGSTAYRIRSLSGDLALVLLICVAFVAGLALTLAWIRRRRRRRLPGLRVCMLSRRCHAVLAVPVVYELLGGVVQRAGAVLAGKVVAVQLPLIGCGGISGSSAAVLGRLLIYLLITAFWLAL